MSETTMLWFTDEACRDVRQAGGKGASLAAMTAQGWPVPTGFAIPACVLERSVDAARLRDLVLSDDYLQAQRLVRQAEPPRAAIIACYERLGATKVAVRSSACAEDSETASFAGQMETYLNVSGGEEVCARVVDCWASFFSERALFYRRHKGTLIDLGMAVIVQKMLDPAKAGVIFTVDPVNRRRDRMIIEAVAGLGEHLVSGAVTPDHYVVDVAGNVKREHIVASRVLAPEEIRQLVALGAHLTAHFGAPQDIEWAIAEGKIYLLQSRPVTTL